MQLADGEVHIYAASLQLPPQQLTTLDALLGQDEQERAQRFHFPIHRERFIAAHGILRLILGWYLNAAPGTIKFRYSDHRKPFLADNASLQFNLSHSDDFALYAITGVSEIGVDVEKIRPDDDKAAVAQRFFSDREKTALFALPNADQTTAFYRLWSGKEAIIKASGKGLSQPLSSFSIHFDLSPQIVIADDKQWYLHPLTIHPEFAAAVAVAKPITRISICDIIDQKAVKRSSLKLPY